MASALLALSDAIRSLREGAHAVEEPDTAELVIPARVDREAVILATGIRQVALSGNEDLLDGAQRAFRIRHLFKTYQEVLSTYGAPDTILVNGPIREWQYRNRLDKYQESFGFSFDNGTVCEAWYNCDPDR